MHYCYHLLKSFLLLLTSFLISSFIFSQCPGMTGALINSCGPEGANEKLYFINGNSLLTVNSANIDVRYDDVNPPVTKHTDAILDAGNQQFVDDMNAQLGACTFSFVNAVENVTVILPGERFIITSKAPTEVENYSAWCGQIFGSVYVIFSESGAWGTNNLGNFANAPGTDRFFRVLFPNNCDITYSYNDGWGPNANGDYAVWANPQDGGPATDYLNYPGCIPNNVIILPVELIDFQAKLNVRDVDIAWTTASEKNSSHFEVERSTNGLDFNAAGTVQAAGNSNQTIQYKFADKDVVALNQETVWYRLKSVDQDETHSYSDITAVNLTGDRGLSFAIYPNPASDVFSLTTHFNESFDMSILDGSGRSVYETQGLSFGSYDFSAGDLGLSSGVYIIRLTTAQGVATERLVIQ